MTIFILPCKVKKLKFINCVLVLICFNRYLCRRSFYVFFTISVFAKTNNKRSFTCLFITSYYNYKRFFTFNTFWRFFFFYYPFWSFNYPFWSFIYLFWGFNYPFIRFNSPFRTFIFFPSSDIF